MCVYVNSHGQIEKEATDIYKLVYYMVKMVIIETNNTHTSERDENTF